MQGVETLTVKAYTDTMITTWEYRHNDKYGDTWEIDWPGGGIKGWVAYDPDASIVSQANPLSGLLEPKPADLPAWHWDVRQQGQQLASGRCHTADDAKAAVMSVPVRWLTS